LQIQLQALKSIIAKKDLYLDHHQANALRLYAFLPTNHHEQQFQYIIPMLFHYPFLIHSSYYCILLKGA